MTPCAYNIGAVEGSPESLEILTCQRSSELFWSHSFRRRSSDVLHRYQFYERLPVKSYWLYALLFISVGGGRAVERATNLQNKRNFHLSGIKDSHSLRSERNQLIVDSFNVSKVDIPMDPGHMNAEYAVLHGKTAKSNEFENMLS